MCKYHAASSLNRRGITLLEVLVSMFILLFGLVGVASLYPVGAYHTRQAIQYDEAAAVGQRAFEEIRVRGYLRPGRWNNQNGSAFTANTNWQRLPVLFDPLGTAPPNNAYWAPVGASNHLQRVTWRTTDTGSNMSAETADYIFRFREDLALELPGNRSLPAIQRISSSQREAAGAYSWAFTASPAPEMGEGMYLVSVVVFRNRTLAQEWKTAAPVPVPGDSWGLGSLQLVASGPEAKNQINRIRVGEWILLSYPADNWFRWYKIVNLTKHLDLGAMYVQVAGPAWNPAYRTNMYASVFSSVVAVYEQTMRVQSDLDWSID